MSSRSRLTEQREVLVAALGRVCSCRGEDCWHDDPCRVTDPRCLQLDHVNGDGFADRRRLGGQGGVIAYYFSHLTEARATLQVLCANCNWVKRVRDGEVRNGRAGRGSVIAKALTEKNQLLRSVESMILSTPRYLELVDKYHGLVAQLVRTSYTDLFDWLVSLGLDDGQQCTVSHYLAKHWIERRSSGGTEDELARFVGKCVVDVDAITSIYRDRVRERELGLVS